MTRLRVALSAWFVRLAVRVLNPPPVRTNETPIADLVVSDLLATGKHNLIPIILGRKELGLAKYGTVLQAGNGRDHALDALQEAADLVKYLRAEIEKAKGPGVRRRVLRDYHDATRLLESIAGRTR